MQTPAQMCYNSGTGRVTDGEEGVSAVADPRTEANTDGSTKVGADRGAAACVGARNVDIEEGEMSGILEGS